MSLPDQDEAASRVRAALAYADLKQVAAMKALNVSRSTLARLTGKKGDERKAIDWSDLWQVADACEIPRAWFSADLDRLDEIVPDGLPTFAKPKTPTLKEAARKGARRRTGTPAKPPADQPQRPPKAQES